MNSPKLLSAKNALTVGFIALLIALSAFSFSLWQTPSYKSTVKFLAVFNQSDIDTYTASKTANYITGILGEVVYSDSFINSVYKNDSALSDRLGQGSETRQKNWKKIIKTQILDNKGIIIIDVYGNDKNRVSELASAIGNTIVAEHGIYDGSQDRVTIKMIDLPSVYEGWSSMKILRDTGLGLLAGLLIGFSLIIIFPNHKLFEFNQKKNLLVNFPIAGKRAYQAYQPTEPITEEMAATEIEPPTETYLPADNSTTKTTNPWLEQYYEENPNIDTTDQDNS